MSNHTGLLRLLLALAFGISGDSLFAQHLHWEEIEGPPGQTDIRCITVTAAGTMYVGTGWQGIFKSTDGGGTWKCVYAEPRPDSIGFISSRGDTVVAVFAGRLIHSTNGGDSWNTAYPGGDPAGTSHHFLAFDTSGTLWNVVGGLSFGGHTVRHTRDLGYHWDTCAHFSAQGLFSLWTDLFTSTTGEIYALSSIDTAAFDTLWRATESSCGFTQIGLDSVFHSRSLFIDSRGMMLRTPGIAEGWYVSTDSGQHWVRIAQLPPIACFVEDVNGYLYAGTSAGLLVSRDRGQHWTKRMSGSVECAAALPTGGIVCTNGFGGLVVVPATNDSVLYPVHVPGTDVVNSMAATANGDLMVLSSDSLVYAARAGECSLSPVACPALATALKSDGVSRFYAVTLTGITWTSDCGRHWSGLRSPTKKALFNAMFACNAQGTLVIGADTGRFVFAYWVSTDTGLTWREITPALGLYSFAVAFNGDVFGCDFNTIVHYRPSEGTWRTLDNLTLEQSGAFVTSPLASPVFVVDNRYSKASRTTDYGETWSPVPIGQVLAIDTRGTLYALPVDYAYCELRRSTDWGESWSILDMEFPGKMFACDSSGTIFVATNAGVFRSVGPSTAVAEVPPLSPGLLLEVSPSPSHAHISIHVGTHRAERVQLSIYDALGRHVAALSDRVLFPGQQVISFDASSLPTGVYVVQAKNEIGVVSAQMLVVR